MDELKKYLQQNREALDTDEPGDFLLDTILRESRPVRKITPVYRLLRVSVAAAILLLAGTGAWLLLEKKTVPATTSMVSRQPAAGSNISAAPKTTDTQEDTRALAENTIEPQPSVADRKKAAPVMDTKAAELLNNLESSFTQVINLQREKISHTPMYAESPDYFSDFRVQFRQMDRDEKTIKRDISKKGLSDPLLNQLINLYQQKLNMLRMLQTEMNKTNNRYQQNRAPVDTLKTYFLNL
jgi:hypothetical protein